MCIVDARDDRGGEMFQAFKAVEAGVGLKTDAADRGVEFFQAAGGAYESAGGAQACYEMGDGAVRLLPDFRGGCGVMRGGICGIAVLVRIEIFFAIGFVDFAHAADGAVGAFVTWSVDDVYSVGCEDVFAFWGGAGGKAEFYAIAERGADHGVGDAGIAAGRVEDYFAGA